MSEFVTDAHPLIWHLTRDKRLSASCRQIFTEADAGTNVIWIPAIVVVEMIFLIERRRFPTALLNQTYSLLLPPTVNYRLRSLDLTILNTLQEIERETVPEMPDRIIAATALSLNLPLLSRDHVMADVDALQLIW